MSVPLLQLNKGLSLLLASCAFRMLHHHNARCFLLLPAGPRVICRLRGAEVPVCSADECVILTVTSNAERTQDRNEDATALYFNVEIDNQG